MASCSSTSTYPSTGTPKLKLKITKEDKKLTVEVLEQDERFWSGRGSGDVRFCASNGFWVKSFGSVEIGFDTLFLRGTGGRDAPSTRKFNNNAARDIYLARLEGALRDWAENAPEFKSASDTSGRIVTFKSDKAEVEFVKFEKALAMQVKRMDERFHRKDSVFSCPDYLASNGLIVRSAGAPELNVRVLFLLGSNVGISVAKAEFESNEERDAYLARALEALDDWSKNWEGWKTEKAKTCICICRCHSCSCSERCCPSRCCCAQSSSDEYIFTV